MEISCLELSYFIVKFKKKHFENFIYGNLVFIVVISFKNQEFYISIFQVKSMFEKSCIYLCIYTIIAQSHYLISKYESVDFL